MLSASLQLMTFQPTDLHQERRHLYEHSENSEFHTDSMKQNLLQNLEFSLLILQSVCIEKYSIQSLSKAVQLMAKFYLTMDHKVLQNNNLIKKKRNNLLFMLMTI